ncbi:MAG: hypothetical protein QXK76_00130 [Candidatus Woesearchaeota archaeon]
MDRYYDIQKELLTYYKSVLELLEEFTDIDTHTKTATKKINASLVNSVLHYSFNKGIDFAKEQIKKNEINLVHLKEMSDGYSKLKISEYKNIEEDKYKGKISTINDILIDTQIAFYLGINKYITTKYTKSIKDYLDEDIKYI